MKDLIGICKDHERLLSFTDCVLMYGYAIEDKKVIENMNNLITAALNMLLNKVGVDILDADYDYGMFKNKRLLMKLLTSIVE